LFYDVEPQGIIIPVNADGTLYQCAEEEVTLADEDEDILFNGFWNRVKTITFVYSFVSG
jgi:hypothetical protein